MTSNIKEKSIVLVGAADDNYAMPLAVTFRSAIENIQSNRKVDLFIIDGGIKKRNKKRIVSSLKSDKCDIHWISSPNHILGEFQVSNKFTIENVTGIGTITEKPYLSNIAAYYRLLIPKLLPQYCQKAIYLDCDLIVNGDLGELYDLEMDDNYLLAVQQFLTPYVSSPAGLLNYQQLNIASDAKYFNSGVLVINMKKWRSEKICSKLIEYLQQNGKYVRWADTDVLNAVLAGKWGELDPRWNQMADIYVLPSWEKYPFSEEVYNQVLHKPYIIHFSSLDKPWATREEHPFKHLWFQYLDLTAWSGWRLTIRRRAWRRLIRELKKMNSLLLQSQTT